MSNSTQNDKQKVTRADIKVTMTFYPREGTQCGYCGISSFAHRHKAGSLPKDFERLPDASKTKDRALQEDWESQLSKSLKSMGLGMSGSQAEWIFYFVRQQRADARIGLLDEVNKAYKRGFKDGTSCCYGNKSTADARKEVIEKVEKELEGLDCGFCNYEKEVKERLATLREEES